MLDLISCCELSKRAKGKAFVCLPPEQAFSDHAYSTSLIAAATIQFRKRRSEDSNGSVKLFGCAAPRK